MEFTVGTKVFGDWEIVGKLGEGASGQVFEIHKEMRGIHSKAALKVIPVPKSKDDAYRLLSDGMDRQSVSNYFMQIVDEIIREVEIMKSLKSNPHIVSCDDYQFIENEGGEGGTILMRMEYLTSLRDYQMEHSMNEIEVRRMMKELCQALVYCQEKGLMHRDIKPENIFIDEDGVFKLGDFGVARTTEKATVGVSKKGTEEFMAPEVFLGKMYRDNVDIYSLGLVVYKCLNRNRLPFFPLEGAFTYADKENALEKRMRGEALPAPVDASERLSKVILKACAYNPENRYQKAVDLQKDLEMLDHVAETKPQKVKRVKTKPEKSKKKKSNKKRVMVGLAGVVVLAGAAFVLTQTDILKKKYTVVVEGGSGSGKYTAGEIVKIEAEEPEEGYQFASWEVNQGNVEISDITMQNAEFVMTEEEVKILAAVELTAEKMFEYGEEAFGTQNYVDALSWFEKAAFAGNVDAEFYLGYMYHFGLGVEQDFSEAFTWYNTAADAGHSEAMNGLGLMYSFGEFMEHDYEEAFSWYEKAVELGNENAIDNFYDACVWYHTGDGVEQDYDKALAGYKKVSEWGNTDAMKAIGVMYYRGEGVVQDYEEAFAWFEKAAELGHAGAMNNLGVMYYLGNGTEADFDEAVYYYEQAASLNDMFAMNNLGYLYEEGLITGEKDYEQALEWFEQAADFGNNEAMFRLGEMYECGMGVEVDCEQALKWYERAAIHGNSSAMYTMGLSYEYGFLGLEEDQRKAQEWYEKEMQAVALDNTELCYGYQLNDKI